MRLGTGSNSAHSALPWVAIVAAWLALPALSALGQGVDAAGYPVASSGYVTDIARALSSEQQERIEGFLWQLERKTSVEMVVVTIKSLADYPGTPNRSIESFATALFNRWGVGNRPRNDGVMLLVSIEDRKARIELGAGHGAARDKAAQRIMDDAVVPRFRSGDYAGGIEDAVRALALEFGGRHVGWNWPLIAMVASVPVTAAVGVSLYRNGKRGWGWVFLGLTIVLVLGILYLLLEVLKRRGRRSGSWSSGGLGGFGGGFSGGGGATGSW